MKSNEVLLLKPGNGERLQSEIQQDGLQAIATCNVVR